MWLSQEEYTQSLILDEEKSQFKEIAEVAQKWGEYGYEGQFAVNVCQSIYAWVLNSYLRKVA